MLVQFPTGTSALHPDWPDARFNVSGLFVYHALVRGLSLVMDRGFGCRSPVSAVHGAPGVRWNGGRVSPLACKLDEVNGVLNEMHEWNIGCFLTFSNHRLEQADLADPASNYLLECIAQRPDLNGVIVSSELLSKYIAEKYPDLPQVASIVKVTMEKGRGKPEYYHELGRRYHRYVLHPDDGFNLRLLDQLDRDKAEILINENCIRECANRVEHYHDIARVHKTAGAGPLPDSEQRPDACTFLGQQLGLRRRNCNMAPTEVKAIYDMGFRHLKLQGRRESTFSFLFDLVRYTVEPQVAAPFVFKSLCMRIKFT